MNRVLRRVGAPLAVLLLVAGLSVPASAQKPKLRVWLLRNYASDLSGRFSVYENERLRIR